MQDSFITRALDLSIVIPVYGSEAVLRELRARIDETMRARGWSYEIIFVCDRSPDNAWNVIDELSGEHPEVRGLLLRTNAGQHNAILAGLSHARGAVIVTMDDDLQHAPADIPLLVDAVHAGADVAYGKFASRRHPGWKILGSQINNLVASYLMRKPTGLYLSPFRAFIAEIGEEIVSYAGPFVYLDGIILATTRDITSVEVSHNERYAGESRYGLRKSISLWLKMATNFSILPLRVTSLLGLVTAALGFVVAIVFVVQKLTIDVMPTGWASLVVTILVIGGIQLIGIGILGEYLGRVLLALNGRPQYVVAKSVRIDPDPVFGFRRGR